jgi:predicted TPR repeat methyltransferase
VNIFISIIRPIARLCIKGVRSYKEILGGELMGFRTILDLGCGKNSPILQLNLHARTIGVDVFDAYLNKDKEVNHTDYVKADLRTAEFKNNSIEVVVALDVIEHLPKEDGLHLMDKMERWASKKVIIFTPNGFIQNSISDSNVYQQHTSGYHAGEFIARGYKVYGMNGWRFLRKEGGCV